MSRTLLSTSCVGLSLLLAGATAATAASLTRIETRPFYGATVTIEEGVRVFRPLPPHRHIIINPDGKTPLNLTIEERNTVVHQYLYSVGEPDGGGLTYGGSFGFFPGDRFKPRRFRNHRRQGGHMIHVPRGRGRGGIGGR